MSWIDGHFNDNNQIWKQTRNVYLEYILLKKKPIEPIRFAQAYQIEYLLFPNGHE